MNRAADRHPPLRLPELLRDAGRFFRFSVLGFSLLLPLVGAASVSPALSGWQLAVLAAVGIAFHIFIYVSNDVFDLPIDRTQPLRAGSPLVRGEIRPSLALAISLVPVPTACLIHLWAGGPLSASVSLLIAMAFGLLYNLYGKRIGFPLVSDAIQGAAWVALAVYGALATGVAPREPLMWFSATVFLYVLMVNAFHGDLRDLENDAHHRAHTTAIYLGARITPDGRLFVPATMRVYGIALQILLLILPVLCVLRNGPMDSRLARILISAVIAGHLILFWLGRAALRATATRPEMIRAGVAHLFLSIGVVCLPYAFFTGTTATLVIVGSYVAPLLVLALYLAWSSMKRASPAPRHVAASLCLIFAAADIRAQSQVIVVSRGEIIRAMRAERAKGYNVLATANGARFNAAVILDLARAARNRDPARAPILLDHRDYHDAFLQMAGVSAADAPAFIQMAYAHREDQYVDYRRENVIRKIKKGRQPGFAVNVIAGWTGPPARYSYEDLASEPPLRVTHERISSYRLLDFGDMIVFDEIEGIHGRALGGLLGLVFRVIGDAQAVRAFIAISPDGEQVTLSTGRKGLITVTTTATVDRSGRGQKGVPPGKPELRAIEKRLKQPLDAEYVPLQKMEVFQHRRVNPQ